MKIISLEFKKITIGRFLIHGDKVEFNISFSDGNEKEVAKVLDASDSEKAAKDIVADITKMVRTINKEEGKKEIINIVINDEDKVVDAISSFIRQAKIKVDKIKSKHDAVGYLDMIRDLKSLKLEF